MLPPHIETMPVRAQRDVATIRVLAAPAFKMVHLNPYCGQLYSELVRLGVTVEEFTFWKAFSRRFDIVHLHWPEYYIAQKNPLKALLGSVGLLLACAWSRCRGARVVWTVHNTLSHNQSHPLGERLFWQMFACLLDGYICLTECGRRDAQELRPILRRLPSYVIPHGHYRGAYPCEIDPAAARSQFGIPENTKVVLFFGVIAPYKNVLELVEAFRQLPDSGSRLLIAGVCPNAELKKSLVEAAKPDPRIGLHLDFVSRERVQVFFRAADLVALPYREILNSGSALLALSFDCPVLVPARGAMPELQEEIGSEWVRLFSGELNASELQEALEWATSGPRSMSAPMDHLNWTALAADTRRAFEALSGTMTHSLHGQESWCGKS
jgi:beta-1,4-mannosyltransferase